MQLKQGKMRRLEKENAGSWVKQALHGPPIVICGTRLIYRTASRQRRQQAGRPPFVHPTVTLITGSPKVGAARPRLELTLGCQRGRRGRCLSLRERRAGGTSWERSEGRGLRLCHAVGSSGRATRDGTSRHATRRAGERSGGIAAHALRSPCRSGWPRSGESP